MKPPKSIYYKSLTGLSGVSLFCTLFLFLIVIYDYHVNYEDLAVMDLASKAWQEVFKHVLLPVIIGVVTTSFAVIAVVRHSLKPLQKVALEIEQMHAQANGYRLPLYSLPKEAKPFAKAINNLLERLEKSAAQQEAFAADIAHELRTPLALARLELAEIGGEAKAKLSGDLQSMQRLIDQLLLLAQIKAAESNEISKDAQDLSAISEECVAALAPRAILDGRNLEFESLGDPVFVQGWREAIQAALRNLIENALRVTPEGQSVRVLVGPDPCIRVRDGGPGLTADDLEGLLKRHVRAHNPSKSGAGLGLPIINQIMQAQGGRLVTNPEYRELRLEFREFG